MRLHAGAYADGAVWEKADGQQRLLLRALATQFAAPDAVAYETTAATIWGLPVRNIPERLTFARELGMPGMAHAKTRRLHVPIEEITDRRGLTTTTLVRTTVDVAASEPLPDALITVDAALRRGVRPVDLEEQWQKRGEFSGSARSRSALAAGDPSAETPLESLSRGRMIERHMPIPRCNVVIRFGNQWVRVDCLWEAFGVVGECDGKVKYADLGRDVIWKEKRRHEWLEDLGFELARWGYPEVADDGEIMERRFWRAAHRQQQVGWQLRPGVVIEAAPISPQSGNPTLSDFSG